mmetsp:Transcript_27299/g.49598  ORF Transcript_27299/g.49598 Transcript_27299/m.49598 type:complete len:230 (+) Transcript_27299:296-985(+)
MCLSNHNILSAMHRRRSAIQAGSLSLLSTTLPILLLLRLPIVMTRMPLHPLQRHGTPFPRKCHFENRSFPRFQRRDLVLHASRFEYQCRIGSGLRRSYFVLFFGFIVVAAVVVVVVVVVWYNGSIVRFPHGTTIRGIIDGEYDFDLFGFVEYVIDVPFHSRSAFLVHSNLDWNIWCQNHLARVLLISIISITIRQTIDQTTQTSLLATQHSPNVAILRYRCTHSIGSEG